MVQNRAAGIKIFCSGCVSLLGSPLGGTPRATWGRGAPPMGKGKAVLRASYRHFWHPSWTHDLILGLLVGGRAGGVPRVAHRILFRDLAVEW